MLPFLAIDNSFLIEFQYFFCSTDDCRIHVINTERDGHRVTNHQNIAGLAMIYVVVHDLQTYSLEMISSPDRIL
jgi:hypothetical protein